MVFVLALSHTYYIGAGAMPQYSQNPAVRFVKVDNFASWSSLSNFMSLPMLIKNMASSSPSTVSVSSGTVRG
jgi:hypothetical protein